MMYINELCVSPARICPFLDFWGSWGNFNVNYLFDLFVPPFGSPTIIGGLLAILCSWGLLGLMQYANAPVFYISILGSRVIRRVGPTYLT